MMEMARQETTRKVKRARVGLIEVRQEIISTIGKPSNGVFRWALK